MYAQLKNKLQDFWSQGYVRCCTLQSESTCCINVSLEADCWNKSINLKQLGTMGIELPSSHLLYYWYNIGDISGHNGKSKHLSTPAYPPTGTFFSNQLIYKPFIDIIFFTMPNIGDTQVSWAAFVLFLLISIPTFKLDKKWHEN